MLDTSKIRNVAIIAHVDHGKTTLVDKMLHQSGTFQEHQTVAERVMDSNDLEKERGITILAKCTAILWKDHKINIVDTPGHADFGGEVERVLSMVSGVVLLVDSSEGVMPQTKFVLSKALKLNLKPIVIVNKVDRPDRRIKEVLDEILELFMALEATDEQLDFPVFYGSGREGWMSTDADKPTSDLTCVFDKILEYVPQPEVLKENDGKFSFLATILGHDSFVGRLLTGRVYSGEASVGQQFKALNCNNEVIENAKIVRLNTALGINQETSDKVVAGDIITLAGFQKASVSDTICDKDINNHIKATPIDPPTISIGISVNTSPFSGKDGKKVTSSLIRDRLLKEAEHNISIKVQESDDKDSFTVSGRGELQLGVLIENMRREGFELTVSRPKVIYKQEGNAKLEPIEEVTIDVDQEYSSVVIKKLNLRKGEMIEMKEIAGKTRLIFWVPSRGLIGYRSEFLTDTRGTGVLNRVFHDYKPYKGDIESYRNGVLISTEQGPATGYAIFNLQDRGIMFVKPQDEVYVGMIVGEHSRENDLEINVIKGKQLTNVRASGSDEAIRLVPAKIMTLEDMISYIRDDECIEVTPNFLRLRKVFLDPNERKKRR